MKLKVEKDFNDKITGAYHKAEEVIEVDEERAEELLNHPLGLVTKVKEPKKASKAKSQK